MSAVVQGFLEPETDDAKAFKWWIQADWKDVPHLDEAEKRALVATTPAYQLQARTEGGAGAGCRRNLSDRRVRNHRADPSRPQHLAQGVRHGCRLEQDRRRVGRRESGERRSRAL
jgi:hypothetical protein